MAKTRKHRRDVAYVFLMGMLLLPLLLLWSAGLMWSLVISLGVAGALAWLAHARSPADGHWNQTEVHTKMSPELAHAHQAYLSNLG